MKSLAGASRAGINPMWSGNYPSWDEALKKASGYDMPAILEKVRTAALEVKKGNAAFERDSVLFFEKEFNWPLVGCLLHVANQYHGVLELIDFGGGLGSSYFQNKELLTGLKKLKWMVVEQEHFVRCGQKEMEEPGFSFHLTLEEAMEKGSVKVMLLSSVLQYLEKPYEFLDQLIKHKPDYLLFDRTAFVEKGTDRITLQNVPPEIYPASYPAWFLDEGKFMNHIQKHYKQVASFDPYPGLRIPLDDTTGINKGFLFKAHV
ncbi:MAG: TIGR04325 family methyltransferase [Bacteroidia bacterium]